jgi:hypothetical protein
VPFLALSLHDTGDAFNFSYILRLYPWWLSSIKQGMQQLAHGLELQAGLAPDALYDAGGDLAPEAAQLRERLLSLFDAVEWICRVLILWR